MIDTSPLKNACDNYASALIERNIDKIRETRARRMEAAAILCNQMPCGLVNQWREMPDKPDHSSNACFRELIKMVETMYQK